MSAEAPAQPSGAAGVWVAIRSWIFTLILAVGIFMLATTFVGGPIDNGTAIDFQVETLDGATLRAADLRGKPVVIYVWATWCGACKLTTPTVDNFATRHPELTVLAVAADDPAAVRAAVQAEPRSFRVVPDGTALAQQLGVRAFPTTIVIGADGTVIWNRQGVLLPGELDVRTLGAGASTPPAAAPAPNA
ncbi:MAG: TlpA family protein disulfide reductase [Deltaproteobacteria bacterium]|nr:TlpA family protein disulfide reductase [Deltaproteobacteria bacterium]